MLEVASEVIRFSLALWVGGTLVTAMAAPLLFREIPSRDLAGRLFGELLRRFEAVKHLLSLLLVLAVFAELEITRVLGGRSFVSGIAIFVAVATNVYLAMVVRPRLGYFRMKGAFFAFSVSIESQTNCPACFARALSVKTKALIERHVCHQGAQASTKIGRFFARACASACE